MVSNDGEANDLMTFFYDNTSLISLPLLFIISTLGTPNFSHSKLFLYHPYISSYPSAYSLTKTFTDPMTVFNDGEANDVKQ